MDVTELANDIKKLESKCDLSNFAEIVDNLKDLCNNFALKMHCQSSFIIDKENDFLAEVFSKETCFFVAANRRLTKTIFVMYCITK